MKRRSSGTEADGVRRADVAGEGLLELGDFGSGCQPFRAQHLNDCRDVVFSQRLARIGKQVASHRLAAIERESIRRHALHPRR